MNPQLLSAIDQIGRRPASRFEWEWVTGLPWSAISPYLVATSGYAREVPAPGGTGEHLIACPASRVPSEGYMLVSAERPPTGEPIRLSTEHLRLHRADVAAVARDLAAKLHFVAQPGTEDSPMLRIGIAQAQASLTREVLLLLPAFDPASNVAALHAAASAKQPSMLLLLAPRWLRFLPRGTGKVEVRELSSYFAEHQEDHFANIVAKSERAGAKKATCPLVEVRTGDRWEEVRLCFVVETGILHVGIGARKGETKIWNPRAKSSRHQKNRGTRAAEIFVLLASNDPPRWEIKQIADANRQSMRKAFQLLKDWLKDAVPISDGEPFVYDPITKVHRPRFQFTSTTRTPHKNPV